MFSPMSKRSLFNVAKAKPESSLRKSALMSNLHHRLSELTTPVVSDSNALTVPFPSENSPLGLSSETLASSVSSEKMSMSTPNGSLSSEKMPLPLPNSSLSSQKMSTPNLSSSVSSEKMPLPNAASTETLYEASFATPVPIHDQRFDQPLTNAKIVSEANQDTLKMTHSQEIVQKVSEAMPLFEYKVIRNIVDEVQGEYHEKTKMEIRNMHLELIRQFQFQKVIFLM